MSTQMYADLIVEQLSKAAVAKNQPVTFSSPVVGTFSGSTVNIDAFPEPVPYSDFALLTDDKSSTKPSYKNGDRLVILPANDGKQLIIIGRLI